MPLPTVVVFRIVTTQNLEPTWWLFEAWEMRGLSWIYNYVDLDPARKATAHKELDIFVYIFIWMCFEFWWISRCERIMQGLLWRINQFSILEVCVRSVNISCEQDQEHDQWSRVEVGVKCQVWAVWRDPGGQVYCIHQLNVTDLFLPPPVTELLQVMQTWMLLGANTAVLDFIKWMKNETIFSLLNIYSIDQN